MRENEGERERVTEHESERGRVILGWGKVGPSETTGELWLSGR